jgi:AcrR family transcriptional regulator
MSMGSDISISRRIPQQERGEKRVADLLEAAASELAKVGYDSTTMKAIAKRAGASVGAVYQYFPDKEAVFSALRTQYANEMEGRWISLEKVTAGSSVKERTEGFVDMMVRFMEEHPAYIPVLDAPVNSKRDEKIRGQLRDRLVHAFLTRRPGISRGHACRVASVSLQMIKSMSTLYASARPRERPEIVKEYKIALTAYLEKRLIP